MALVPYDEERQLAMTSELPEEPIQAVTRFDMTSTKRALGSTMGQKTNRKLLRPLDRTATLSKLLSRTQKREEREAAAQEGGPSDQDVNRQALKDFFFALQVRPQSGSGRLVVDVPDLYALPVGLQGDRTWKKNDNW